MNNDWIAVCRNPNNIKKIKNPSRTILLKAVSLNGDFIKHVKDQTEELCWAALENDYQAIKYIKNPTLEMWDYVLSIDSGMASFLDVTSDIYLLLEAKYPHIAEYCNRTEQVWLQIIESWKDAFVVSMYKDQANEWTPLVIDAIISKIPLSIRYIPNLTYDHYRKAVDLDGDAIIHVPIELIDEDLCWLSYKTSHKAIKYLPNHYLTESFYLDTFAKYPLAVVDMPKEIITYDMWFDAVRCNVDLFRIVPEEYRSDEMCLYAVNCDGHNISHVPEQTEELCWLALKKNVLEISKIKIQTDEMKWFALENDVFLHFINDPTDEMIEYALDKSGDNITYIKNPKPEWIEKAIRYKPSWIGKYDASDELIWIALRLQPNVIMFVRKPNIDMIRFTIESNRKLFRYVAEDLEGEDVYYELALLAVDHPKNLQYVKYQTEEICLKAVRLDGSVFEYSHYQTQEIIDAALANVDDPDIVLRWLNQSSLI